jgi:hypothetical protein
LREWMMLNIKNKDLFLKKIIKLTQDVDGYDFVVEYADKKQYFIVRPLLGSTDDIIKKMNPEGHFAIVVLNKRDNLNMLIKSWSKLIEFKNLCIYFVNPASSTDKKWVIFPYTHNKVRERSSLELGLKSMFEIVEPAI